MNEIQFKAYQEINDIRELTPEIVDWFFNSGIERRCFKDIDRAKAMCEMRLQGATYKEIAKAFGLKSTTTPRDLVVHKVLRYYRYTKCKEIENRGPSNKERIQSMPVKELAAFLLNANQICFSTCEAATGNKYKCPFADGEKDLSEQCLLCHIKWLESESDSE